MKKDSPTGTVLIRSSPNSENLSPLGPIVCEELPNKQTSKMVHMLYVYMCVYVLHVHIHVMYTCVVLCEMLICCYVAEVT